MSKVLVNTLHLIKEESVYDVKNRIEYNIIDKYDYAKGYLVSDKPIERWDNKTAVEYCDNLYDAIWQHLPHNKQFKFVVNDGKYVQWGRKCGRLAYFKMIGYTESETRYIYPLSCFGDVVMRRLIKLPPKGDTDAFDTTRYNYTNECNYKSYIKGDYECFLMNIHKL